MTKTDKTSITRQEYLQLMGIKAISDKYMGLIHELVKQTLVITGEYEDGGGEPYGHATDFVWGDCDADALCRKLNFPIPDPPAESSSASGLIDTQ